MNISDWAQLPEDFAFDYDQSELADIWDTVHQGDQYPYPLSRDDYEEETLASQAEAWRLYHNGDYQGAAQLALDLGDFGAVVLAKSVAAYCDYLCEDEDQALELLSSAMEVCEAAAESLPNCANTHFVNALLMGRYSQRISITKALSQGLGGKIKNHLSATLELEPNHAEAHTAMGLYHAEIIDKVGAMLGGLTYGAKKPKSLEHFERSLELTPETPITAIEFANGLMLLGEDEERATQLYEHATECSAHDALQNCDISFANDQFEE